MTGEDFKRRMRTAKQQIDMIFILPNWYFVIVIYEKMNQMRNNIEV